MFEEENVMSPNESTTAVTVVVYTTKGSIPEIQSEPHHALVREGEESLSFKPHCTMVCEGKEMTKKTTTTISASDRNVRPIFWFTKNVFNPPG